MLFAPIVALRQLLRWLFALAAAALLPATISHLLTLARQGDIRSLPVAYGVVAAFLAASILFAVACWTTRQPHATPNAWAIAASLVNVGLGALLLSEAYRAASAAWPGMLLLAAGVAGLAVFCRTDASPRISATARKYARITGDRTHPWIDHAVPLLFCAAAYAASRFWSGWAPAHSVAANPPLVSIGLILLAVLVTSVLHELGHAAIAGCFRMKLLSFHAGPLQWRRIAGRWSFKLQISGLVTLGGAVSVVPTDVRQPIWQDICMIAGGPIASMVAGGVLLSASVHAAGSFYANSWEFVANVASFSIIAAVVNLLPFRAGQGAYSDGARVLQLLTKSPVADLQRTVAATQSTRVTARRPRDLDAEGLQRTAERFSEHSIAVHLHLSAAQSYEDAGWLAGARAALASAEAAADRSKADVSASLHTAFVYGHAVFNRDAVAAREWWERMQHKKPDQRGIDYWLAYSALLWIEGRQLEAEQAWRRADAEAALLPAHGFCEYDRSRCARVRRDLTLTATAAGYPVRILCAIPVAAEQARFSGLFAASSFAAAVD